MVAYVAIAYIRRSFAIHEFGVCLAKRFAIVPRELRSLSSRRSPANANVFRWIVSTGPRVEENDDYDEQEGDDSDLSFIQDKRARTCSQLGMTPIARANPTDVVLLSIPEAIMAEFVDLLCAMKSDISW